METLKILLPLSRVMVISILLISLVPILFLCFFIVELTMTSTDTSDEFCNTSEKVFQEIQSNYTSWIEYFSTNATANPQFTVDNISRRFIVIPEYSNHQLLLFYVSTRPGWPNTPQGSRGYIFSIGGRQPTGFWSQNYRLSRLEGNIFCYLQ